MDVVKHFRLSHDPFRTERDAVDGPMLTHEEARRYVATRVGAAGHTDLFSPAALDLLATASRGRPAALRLLASNAMFHAAFDGARRIEETHARQAAATQDIWRDVPAPAAATAAGSAATPTSVVAPAVEARRPEAAVVVPAAALAAAPVDVDEVDDVAPRRRRWWQGAPPLVRLAMVVGLALLSLPVIGYVVGAVKDERPAADSSYLPDEGEVADAEVPIDAAPEVPPVATPAPVEVAEGRPPVDLTAQTTIPEEPAPGTVAEEPAAAEPPVVVGAGAAEPTSTADPAPIVEETAPEPAAEPVAAAPRVFVHYSTGQAGGADAAADVARRLREQGFDVVDIRAVPMSIETASVRYFFPADRARAEALHDALGVVLRPRGYSAGDLKSMTDYDPAPRRGTLEVWVPAG